MRRMNMYTSVTAIGITLAYAKRAKKQCVPMYMMAMPISRKTIHL